ncbi:MAG: alpha-amylase family glycosyl hydrolase, partial [Acidimicrobiia bacterium]
ASSIDNPKRDWYVWRASKADGALPNNWPAIFGEQAWTKHPATGEYYLHSFLPSQPDLNWRNPELERAMLDVLRFWLDRGVDGFRIDVAMRAVKDAYLRDNPPAKVIDPTTHKFDPIWSAQEHIHDDRQPDMHVLNRKIRRLLDSYPERYTVGEIHDWDWDHWATFYGDNDELHMPFNFALLNAGTDTSKIRSIITGMEGAIPKGAWPNWVAGNHDEPRIATRLGGLAQARAMAVLLLTLRGTPTLYYGDELGMTELRVPIGEERDPWGKRMPGRGRDGCRSPMQWDPSGGFSTAATTWLPTNSNTDTVNVESQLGDPESTLELYRQLLAVRRQEPALNSGEIVLEPPQQAVLAYKRVGADGATVSVAVNLSSDEHSQPFTGTVLVSTSPALIGEPAPKVLAPWEAVVIGN